MRFFILIFFILSASVLIAQPNRWQQRVKYQMQVTVDSKTNQFTGLQKLVYTNNSPDVLTKLYYHLYFNAFQPNSSMDVRSRELGKKENNGRPDWDARVRDRISKLTETEIGYQKIKSIKITGQAQQFKYHETILEVILTKPILPKAVTTIDIEFEAQIPLQIRRSGRDNPTTGVRYSMSQWYPKLCEYDYEGWHPNPYVAREFYGVWGDFDVTIDIDPTYKLGGTGVLANANEIGWGYDAAQTAELKPTNKALRRWRFVATNVHDFMWAADPDYIHLTKKTANGVQLHVLYDYKATNAKNDADWAEILPAAEKVLPFIEKSFGKYPYPQYSFIQGGDGGMEYPMATLLQGPGLGTVFHEWMHSWYQMILGTNESLYAWMDEGFTSYAEDQVSEFYNGVSSKDDIRAASAKQPNNNSLKEYLGQVPEDHADSYLSYFNLQKSGKEEPLTTHADHFNYNSAYSPAAYSKGAVFMEQLGYIVGAENRNKILLEYYNQWKFKHPNVNDFMQIAERQSNLKLDWYRMYWVNSTKAINYSIDSIYEEGTKTKVRLRRIGLMPMPIDLSITFRDGSSEMHYVPLNLMYGEKPADGSSAKRTVHEPWAWTHPTFIVEFEGRLKSVKTVEIDASKRMADIDRKNNVVEIPEF